MTEHIAAWILNTANTLADDKGRTGVLKIYTKRTQVPRQRNCVALDRIVEHVGLPRDLVVAAIGSLLPMAGTGQKVHIKIVTAERISDDIKRAEKQEFENTTRQYENIGMFYRAAAIQTATELPVFELPADATVN
tara:strand:- start:103 stop:507 length:405 start_codon:yes stop_codon:yes gene_type:complete